MINIKDVDESLTDFQNEFFNTYLSLFPKNTDASKYVLIKNATELFKSKGNENSFKYFFRTLFNEDIQILTPKNEVLVASGGKYKISKVLRSLKTVYSEHGGGQTDYYIALPEINYPQDPFDEQGYKIFGEEYEWSSSTGKWTDKSTTPVANTISVYVNDVLKTSSPIGIEWNLLNLKNSGKFFRTNSNDNGINLGDVRTVEFKPNGSVLYLLGTAIVSNSRIHQVALSTPWDLSSASTSSTFSPPIILRRSDGSSTTMSGLIGFDFKPDGSRVFLSNATASRNFIVEMNLTEAWNVQSIATQSVIDAFFDVIQNRITNGVTSVGTTQLNLNDIKFKSDGTRMFVVLPILGVIDEYSLGTAWQVNTANYLRSANTSSMRPSSAPSLTNPQSILFKDDGTRLFITTTSSNAVFQFSLSDAWNIQSSSYVSHFEPQLGVSAYNLIAANTSGNNFYVGIGNTNSIYSNTTQRALYQFKSDIDYLFDREKNKVKFTTKTDESSNVKIYYTNFDHTLLVNRRIEGANSGARALIESTSSYKNTGQDIFEFQLDQKSIFKTFLGNENYKTTVLAKDESLINVVLQPFSVLSKINIIDGGSSYNVGDPLNIIGGSPVVSATANVSKVFSGNLNLMTVNYGGAGFIPGPNVFGTGITASVQEIDTSGANSANSYVYSDDMIFDLSGTLISNTNYKLNNAFTFSSITTPNVNSRIIDCLRYKTLTDIGPITKVLVFSSTITIGQPLPTLNAQSAFVSVNSFSNIQSTRRPLYLINAGSLGRIDIDVPGSNFSVGDGINIFYPDFNDVRYNPLSPTVKGVGARAFISEVFPLGEIKKIEFCPPRPSANIYVDYTQNGRVNLSVASSTSYRVNGLNFTERFANGKGALITFNIGWDISNLKFQNEQFSPSLNLVQINANFNPRGFSISNTGHRIFILDQNQNLIRQFNLLSNNSTRSANILSQNTIATGITSQFGMKFSSNGSRLYICSTAAPPLIRQFNLTDPWNILTAVIQTGSIATTGIESNPRDMSFSENGKIISYIGTGRKLFQHKLGRPWEISTRSNSVSSIAFSSGAFSNAGNVYLTFTGGGTEYLKANAQVFINVTSNAIETIEIYEPGEYSAPVSVTALTAPTGSATFTVTMDNNFRESSVLNPATLIPTGLFIHPKGQTIFVANNSGIIYHYEMSELWNVSSTSTTPIQSINITSTLDNPFTSFSNTIEFLSFTEDGSKMFVGSGIPTTGRRVFEFDVSVPQTSIAPSTGITNTTMTVPKIGSAGLYIPRTLSLGLSTNNITYVRTRTYEDTRLADGKLYKSSRVSIESKNNEVRGISTNFTNDFKAGDQIIVHGQKRTVQNVISDSLMNVTSVFTVTKDETRQIGRYNTYPLGGINYRMDDLPLAEVDVDSIGGGEQLSVTSIMGDGEDLTMAASKRKGEIEEVVIINPGLGYSSTPEIFLNHIGDKNALATAETQNSFYSYPGYYLTSDGHLSGDKKLQDSIYYNSGTYIIKTKQQFEKFKTSLLNLIHPVGKKLYNEFTPPEIIIESTTTRTAIDSTITTEVS
jgi:hypothetical protein